MRYLVFGLRLQADVSESLRQAFSQLCYHRTPRESVNIARARIAAGSEINRARIETRYGELSQFQDDAMSELHVYGNWAVKGMMALVLRD